MARKLVKTGAGLTLMDMFGVGLAKAGVEQLLNPVVGNGNLKSGAVKLIGAYAIPKFGGSGKLATIVGTALAVDGVEDVIQSLLKGGLNIGQQGNATI